MGHNANEFSTQTLHALEGDPLDMSALKISLNQVLMLEVRRKRFNLSPPRPTIPGMKQQLL
jgi:hypothetical protein